MAKKNNKQINSNKIIPNKIHPWRICPAGQHWVQSHLLHIPPSLNNPAGSLTTRSGHCHSNSSHKDSIYPLEIHEISINFFDSVPEKTSPIDLRFKKGNDFDLFIQGWTKYWNDIFKPEDPLDPNLVKALIATESGFNSNAVTKVGKTKLYARGLMQVTDQSLKILGDTKGELHDYLVHLTQQELLDPNFNICAGIRWLFRKKEIAESRLNKKLTWSEAIQNYKAEKNGSKLIDRVHNYYKKLKK
jgi:hypothetical protein